MSEPSDLPYTSPPRKLIHFFRKSRDQWKAKSQRAKATVKRLENRVRFLEKSKEAWKARAQALEAENARLKAQAPPRALAADGPAGVKKSPR
jgi:lipopolysaccharide export system protein LptC